MGKWIGARAMAERERQLQFETLLREHQRIVFKVAGVYARNPHDRDDLAQEIAVQLWRSYAAFDEKRAKFTTWMYRVALNVAISQVRSVKRSGAENLEPLDDVHLETVGAATATHDEAALHDDRIAKLHAFIAQLDPLNRALVLLYLEDRSHAEIAEVLGISETNVATKLNRIKQKLRGQMTTAETAGVQNGTR